MTAAQFIKRLKHGPYYLQIVPKVAVIETFDCIYKASTESNWVVLFLNYIIDQFITTKRKSWNQNCVELIMRDTYDFLCLPHICFKFDFLVHRKGASPRSFKRNKEILGRISLASPVDSVIYYNYLFLFSLFGLKLVQFFIMLW